MLFSQIKTNLGINLADQSGITFEDADKQTSLQNAYNDICALSQCIIKKATLDWSSDLSYYDFKADFEVPDFLACIAIFNNNNNRWLRDDVNLFQFDRIRSNWETWHSEPEFWTFAALNKTAIMPKQEIATGTFDLYYWATAPTVVDADTPLIATDMQRLFENYSTADLLESVNEFVKAGYFWQDYYSQLETYIERTKSLARSDLRLLI